MTMDKTLSIILPAKNESTSLAILLPELNRLYPQAEVIIVDDGSEDETAEICAEFPVRLLSHPYGKGNGAAIKSGARAASGEVFVFMDADGQHRPENIYQLLEMLDEGYDMAIGARASSAQANYGRGIANAIYNRLATLITGHTIKDLTSGFRAVRANKFLRFLYLLPNGFSYPTSITMAFFRAGYSVCYIPVDVKSRVGRSHIKPLRDGARFLLIIFRIGTLYSPLKIFFPASVLFFIMGTVYYGYTFITEHRFTNMSALLFSVALIIFLIGLVSEQVTTLLYSHDSLSKLDQDDGSS